MKRRKHRSQMKGVTEQRNMQKCIYAIYNFMSHHQEAKHADATTDI